MSLTYGFYNSIEGDRVYDATQFGQIFDGIIKDGVYATYEKGMVVIASTNPGEVIIQPGRAWFNHTWSYNDANVIFQAPAPEVLLDRIDALVLEVNEELASRENSFKWVQGTPSSVPERPTLTNTNTIHQYPLCYIHRYPETTMIQTKDITSMVGTSECPFATGVLEGIDLDAWINQWDDEFHNWENTTKTSFETWMLNQEAVYTAWYDALKSQMDGDVEDVEAWIETIKNIIDSETATHLQNEIDELREEITSGSHIFIHTINSELYGRNVTITTEEGIIYTERFDNTGVAEFKSVPYVGNLTVESSYGTQTAEAVINTPYFARYNFDIAFWAATVNIVGIPDYAGQTVTIKDSASVIAGTVVLDSDGNGVFTAIRPDTYTFTLIYGGETMETTLSVTQETTYTVEIRPTPAGLDLQRWLTAGGVTGTYADFAAVEADEEAVRRLMTIHDAVDYVATATAGDTLMEQIINSDICAKWINLRDYALDTLSSNSDIKAVMDESDKTPIPKVPVMTSATTPSGEVISSGFGGGYPAYNAFDNNKSTYANLSGQPTYIGYHFVSTVEICKASIYFGDEYGLPYISSAILQGSNDGNTWIDLTEDFYSSLSNGYNDVLVTKNKNLYSYYRFYFGQSSGPHIREIQFYTYGSKYGYGEWVLEGQVPTMTSDTAPYGTVEATTYFSGSFLPYQAFAGVNNSVRGWVPHGNDTWGTAKVFYDFEKPIKIKRAWVRLIGSREGYTRGFKVVGSNDKTTWTDLSNEVVIQMNDEATFDTNESTGAYRYVGVVYNSYQTQGQGDITAGSGIYAQFYAYQPKGNVPIMTSNTAPYGEASAASAQLPAYKAFGAEIDSGSSAGWAETAATGWLQYKFANPVCVKKVWFANRIYTNDANGRIQSYKIQASNDGTNFVDLTDTITLDSSHNASGAQASTLLDNDDYYLIYRLTVLSSFSTYAGAGKVQFYGREMKVSVPTMTSNTTPYGVVSANSEHSAYAAWKAFDGDDSTYYAPVANELATNYFIRYKFDSPIVIKGIKAHFTCNQVISDLTLGVKASNDGLSWTDLGLTITHDSTDQFVNEYIDNNTAYSYYELYGKSGGLVHQTNVYALDMCTLQFYGSDYSEYDWDTENPRHYLYDHGVEVEEMDGGTVKQNSNYINDGILVDKLSDYMKTKVYGLPNGWRQMDISNKNPMDFTDYSFIKCVTDLMRLAYLDISSITGDARGGITLNRETSSSGHDIHVIYVGVWTPLYSGGISIIATSPTRNMEISEMWLE